ncbi:terminase small subunit [Micromonospora chalcea]
MLTPRVLLGPEVEKSISSAQILPRDAGAIALVRHYAALIDGASDDKLMGVASDIGPKLLAALAALHMTPASRSTEKGGVPSATPAGAALAGLRASTPGAVPGRATGAAAVA